MQPLDNRLEAAPHLLGKWEDENEEAWKLAKITQKLREAFPQGEEREGMKWSTSYREWGHLLGDSV